VLIAFTVARYEKNAARSADVGAPAS
jgi:hypothetical protein